MIPLDIRKELIDKAKGSMSICHQCEMLSIARSTLYYTPSMAKDKDLELMKELDRLYLEDPTRGTRRMSKELKKKGFQVGRYHVRTLMQTMRMKTIFYRPRTLSTRQTTPMPLPDKNYKLYMNRCVNLLAG